MHLGVTVKQQGDSAGRDDEKNDDAAHAATAFRTRTVLRLVALLLVIAAGFWLLYLLRGGEGIGKDGRLDWKSRLLLP